MKTDGGTHSVQDWAMVTAAQIMPLDDSLSGGRLLEAQKLQVKVAEALVPHHEKHQSWERNGLASHDDHYDTPVEPPQRAVDAAVASIVAASVGTPWESHFAKLDVQAAVGQEIGILFATHSDVERQHHADKSHAGPKARAYKSIRHPSESVA